MIIDHYKNNLLQITRTEQQKLVSLFWKDFNCRQNSTIENLKKIDSLNPNVLMSVAYTSPVLKSTGRNQKKYSYILILYNQGCAVTGETLEHIELKKNTIFIKKSKIEKQKDLDVLLLDKREYCEVTLNKTTSFLSKDSIPEPLCITLSLERDEVFKNIQEIKYEFKKNLHLFLGLAAF